MFINFSTTTEGTIKVKAENVLKTLRVKFPSVFKKGKNYSIIQIREYAKQLDQIDIDALVIFREKHHNEKETPTEWDIDEKGRIKNIYSANSAALRLELAKRGYSYNNDLRVEDNRKILAELERKKFENQEILDNCGENSEHYYESPIQSYDTKELPNYTSTPAGTASIDDFTPFWNDFTGEQEDLLGNLYEEPEPSRESSSVSNFSKGTVKNPNTAKNLHIYENTENNMALAIPNDFKKFLKAFEDAPQKFSGDGSISIISFLRDYERYTKGEDDQYQRENIRKFLTGRAKAFYDNDEEVFEGFATFKEVKDKLVGEFGNKDLDGNKFSNRKQGEFEDPLIYIEDKRTLARRLDIKAPEKTMTSLIIDGLQEKYKNAIGMCSNNSYTELKTNVTRAKHMLKEDNFYTSKTVNEISEVNQIHRGQFNDHAKLEARVKELEGGMGILVTKVDLIQGHFDGVEKTLASISDNFIKLWHHLGVSDQYQLQSFQIPPQSLQQPSQQVQPNFNYPPGNQAFELHKNQCNRCFRMGHWGYQCRTNPMDNQNNQNGNNYPKNGDFPGQN